MLKTTLLVATLTTLPLSALALPNVGDKLGTTPQDVTTALAEMGCRVQEFEADKGKIEAECRDADGREWEIYLDPDTGMVTKVELDD